MTIRGKILAEDKNASVSEEGREPKISLDIVELPIELSVSRVVDTLLETSEFTEKRAYIEENNLLESGYFVEINDALESFVKSVSLDFLKFLKKHNIEIQEEVLDYDFFAVELKNVIEDRFYFLFEKKIITSLSDLNNDQIREILNRGEINKFKYLIEEKGWVDEKNWNNKDILDIMKRGDIKTLKYLVDELGWVNEENWTNPDVKKILESIGYENLKTFVDIFEINIFDEFVDTQNLGRIVLPKIEKYKNTHLFTVLFMTYEDYEGDIEKLDKQIRAVVSYLEVNKKDWENLEKKSQMLAIIDYFVDKGEEAVKISITTKGKREENIHKITELRTGEEKKTNTLYLYIRQGHGEMCSLRALVIARTIQRMMESDEMKQFSDFKMVPYSKDIYPKMIEYLLGLEVLKVRGDDFRNLKHSGENLGLTFHNVKEFSGPGNLPMVTLSSAFIREKMENNKFSLLPLLFNVRDKLAYLPVDKNGDIKKNRASNLTDGKSVNDEFLAETVNNSSDLTKIPSVVRVSIKTWESDILEKMIPPSFLDRLKVWRR